MTSPFELPLSSRIWDSRYRWRSPRGEEDGSIQDTWRRVARALAAPEPGDHDHWADRFYQLLCDFRFLPGGRILAGAGTTLPVTLFNCFVGDAPDGTFERLVSCLDELGRVSLAGGGIGTDFSNVPPQPAAAAKQSALAAGPLPLLPLWDALCGALNAARARRGAMMAMLRCDHPDVEAFIAAKQRPGDLARFTQSLGISDRFMAAVEADQGWPLLFPVDGNGIGGFPPTFGDWPEPGSTSTSGRGGIWRQIRARGLWQAIAQRNLLRSEPGLVFTDTIHRLNPLNYAEEIGAVNPCGEVPLPRFGACDLGSFNLTRFVRAPFSGDARFDHAALLSCVPDAVRMLDNVYDVSAFPTQRQAESARASRRIGLGITGLADTLALLGMRYDSSEARLFVDRVMASLCAAAYAASASLSKEKGAFPQFMASEHLRGEFVQQLPADLRQKIARDGLRNSHLLAIAPTGSISLLANGISSGIEPLVGHQVIRTILLQPGQPESFRYGSYSLRSFQQRFGEHASLPEQFVTVADISPDDQIAMQAVVQRRVDNAVAKTITVPDDFSLERYCALFRSAHTQGLKGLSTHRPGAEVGSVIKEAADHADTPNCRQSRSCG